MKPLTKKLALSVGIALSTILLDISIQLISTGGAEVSKAVAYGIAIGGIARLLGAILAGISTTEA